MVRSLEFLVCLVRLVSSVFLTQCSVDYYFTIKFTEAEASPELT